MKVFAGFILAMVVIIGGIAGFVFSGIYNFSARVPHWSLTLDIVAFIHRMSTLQPEQYKAMVKEATQQP